MSVIRKYPISENRKNEASGAVGLSLPQLARSSGFVAFIVSVIFVEEVSWTEVLNFSKLSG